MAKQASSTDLSGRRAPQSGEPSSPMAVGAGVLGALLALGMSVGDARANGRFPATTGVEFQPGNSSLVAIPVTFGLLVSTDDGASFRWICENSIGYGGTYDPDYAIDSKGKLFATTFDGVRMTPDLGCTWSFAGGPLTGVFASQVEVGPDGRVWVGAAAAENSNIYVSSDEGVTFSPTGHTSTGTWWDSIKIAPSDPNRVYASGFTVDSGGTTPLAIRSVDGGVTFEPMSLAGVTINMGANIYVLGALPDAPDTVFLRVTRSITPVGDAIYRSTDKGDTWTKVLEIADELAAYVARADGQTVIIGSRFTGAFRSTDGGVTFPPLANPPQMACVGERSDGTLFTCGSNWDPDLYALGRSTDGTTWTAVTTFQQTAAPVQCDPGTVQYDSCQAELWCSLVMQLGITSTEVVCEAPADAGVPGIDAGSEPPKEPGCLGCGAGQMAGPLAVLLPMLLIRRRRRV